MRSGTDNRFLNLWRYIPGMNDPSSVSFSNGSVSNGGPDYNITTFREHSYSFNTCTPIHHMWSLAEVANQMTLGGYGPSGGAMWQKGGVAVPAEDPVGVYSWPRFRVAAAGPTVIGDVTNLTKFTDCSSNDKLWTKSINDALLRCSERKGFCVNAIGAPAVQYADERPDTPRNCAETYWLEKLAVQWEQSADNGKTWEYLPDTNIDLNGNKIVIGQAKLGGSNASATQFYGIIDSVRISRGVSRYVGDTCLPYNPLDSETNLIDEHVIFALNLLDVDSKRVPGGTVFKYYVRNHGWLSPGIEGVNESITVIPNPNIEIAAATKEFVCPGVKCRDASPPDGLEAAEEDYKYVDEYAVQSGEYVLVKEQTSSFFKLWQVVDGSSVAGSWLPKLVDVTGLAEDETYSAVVQRGSYYRQKTFVLIRNGNTQLWSEKTVIPALRHLLPTDPPTDNETLYDDKQLLSYSNISSGYMGKRCGIQFPLHEDLAQTDMVVQALKIEDIDLPPAPTLQKNRTVLVDMATSDFLTAGTWGKQTVDGAEATAGKIVLVKDQKNPVENGVYAARKGTGINRQQWKRIPSTDGVTPDNFSDAYIKVQDGKNNLGTCWYSISGDIAAGSAPMRFKRDEVFGVYKDDFCIEAYFKVASFLHPGVATAAIIDSSTVFDKWEGRTGKKMTLLETYYRDSGREGTKANTGIRIHLKPDVYEETGRVYVDIWAYNENLESNTNDNGGWGDPALVSGVIDANQFHHVAVTRNKSTFYLYINGVCHDSFTAQSKLFAPLTRTTAENDMRYRARAFFGPWQDDVTPYGRFVVRPPEFFYDRDNSDEGTEDFNGAAGWLKPTLSNQKNRVINLPFNWPYHGSTSATWPGKPIPNYPAPVHVYIVRNDQQSQTQITVSYQPDIRFPTPTIYADLATTKVDDEDSNDKVIPNGGRLPLFGTRTYIDAEPANNLSVDLDFSGGIPVSVQNIVSGPSKQVFATLGAPAIFTSQAHGLSIGDTVALLIVNESTDPANESVVTVTHGSVSKFHKTGHGFAVGSRVIFRNGDIGVVPNNLNMNVGYYVTNDYFTADTFAVSATPNGPSISTNIVTGSNPATLYVSAAFTGITLGQPCVVSTSNFTSNTFSLAYTNSSAPLAASGAVGGAMYAITTPTVMQITGHGLSVTTTPIVFKSTAANVTMPIGLKLNQPYYVVADGLTPNTFRISETPSGSALYTFGFLSGSAVIVRRPVLVKRTSHGLVNGNKFIFKQSEYRSVDQLAKVTALPAAVNGVKKIVVEIQPTNVEREYLIPECYAIEVAVNDTISLGALLAKPGQSCTAIPDLPEGIFAGTYYYVVNATTNQFEIAQTAGGFPVYAYKTAAGSVSTNIKNQTQLLEIPLTIDGVPVSVGTRVLVKNQNGTDPDPQNGVYIVQEGSWTRAPELAVKSQLKNSQRVLISGGFTNSFEAFLLNIDTSILPRNYQIDSTPLKFALDNTTQAETVQFECRLETGRCSGGRPRSHVASFLAANLPAYTTQPLGRIVRVTDEGASGQNYVRDIAGWTPQPDEDPFDAITVVLDKKVLEVYAITTTNVSLNSVPTQEQIDYADVSGLNNKVIFLRAQTNAAENGVYVVKQNENKLVRADFLSESSQYFDGLLVVPAAGRVKQIFGDVGFKLKIPPGFVLNTSPLECYTNTELTFQAPAYNNEIFRLSKLHLPLLWVGTNLSPTDAETRLPIYQGGRLTYDDQINAGDPLDSDTDDRLVLRIRTRCLRATDDDDVFGRYIVIRTASALDITSVSNTATT